MSRGFVNGFFAVRLPICRHAVLRYGALPLTYLMYAPRPRALRALPDNEYAALIRLLQKKKTPQFVILAALVCHFRQRRELMSNVAKRKKSPGAIFRERSEPEGRVSGTIRANSG